MRRIISLPYRIACTLIALGALLWRASDLFGFGGGLVTIGFAIAPWAALVSLVLCVIGLFVRRPVAAQLMLFACAMLASPFAGQLLPKRTAVAEAVDASRLRIFSFNAWLDRNRLEADRAGHVADLIHAEQPDVVILQEINAANLEVIVRKLQAQRGADELQVHASTSNGFAVISRFALANVEEVSIPVRALRVIAETPNGPVQIWSVHAFRENFLGGDNFLAYPDTSQHRSVLDQTAWLANRVTQSTDPMLIGGDLNTPTGSPAYRHLNAVVQDVQTEAGSGMGFTFPANTSHMRYMTLGPATIALNSPVRLTRIDHVFASPHFSVLTAKVLDDTAGSDHAPVVTEVELLKRVSGVRK